MPSIRVVVVGIENPAQNDASGPRHARVQLTRYLHDLAVRHDLAQNDSSKRVHMTHR